MNVKSCRCLQKQREFPSVWEQKDEGKNSAFTIENINPKSLWGKWLKVLWANRKTISPMSNKEKWRGLDTLQNTPACSWPSYNAPLKVGVGEDADLKKKKTSWTMSTDGEVRLYQICCWLPLTDRRGYDLVLLLHSVSLNDYKRQGDDDDDDVGKHASHI